ncbi:MAG TPA: bifunctional 4-hydroxy-2-oxoglutarate aldolase/2-dehydro-3-deoxy-phosphogluconate aldolase [Terriglobales bacterium]|nr:bifunctional 4-hydroxy-2-oxoglutarate aldolase/2-dehydro-3-deoxy-phosphogluconate aldolase [Terriglobales bacterium]
MTKQEVADRIVEIGIVPVVRASSPKQAAQAAAAVCAGGIPIVEITMTVPGAIEVIAQLATTAGSQVLIGAGTVLDAETAQRCLDAGAQFLVSPGFDPDTVKLANRLGKLIMAGALTPTEVIAAWKAGSDFVKIFPCGSVGGANYIKALKAPLPQVPMVPTGGINLNTAADFIRAGSAALGIGGELVSASALESGNASAITQAAQSYVAIVRDARRATKT